MAQTQREVSQREFLGEKRPHPLYVDERVEQGFSLVTWAAAAVVLAMLGLFLAMGLSANRQPGAPPPAPSERATAPERIVPPQGQTGEVPGSRSPVQR